MLAWRGSEGCESEVKLEEKAKDEVVGRTNGYGIIWKLDVQLPGRSCVEMKGFYITPCLVVTRGS